MIIVAKNSWHYRFIEFNDVWISSNRTINSCEYMSKFLKACLKMLCMMALFFSIGFCVGFNGMVSGIYMIANGITDPMTIHKWIQAEGFGLFPQIMYFLGMMFWLFTIIIGFTVVMVTLGGKWKDYRRRNPKYYLSISGPKKPSMVQKFMTTSAGQILSAWHNKICVPIKYEEQPGVPVVIDRYDDFI